MTDDKNKMLESNGKCYTDVLSSGKPCQVELCRHFLNSDEDLNCSIIAAGSGPRTLQQIGDYYGISRMRVCQIEKAILKKLRKETNLISDFKPSSCKKTDSD